MTLVFLQTAIVLMVPLIVAGILHMAVVKSNALSYLKRPVQATWFGANKTWRGVVLMPLLGVAGVVVARLVEEAWQLNLLRPLPLWPLGLSLGLGYVLAEFPNSYWKRRQGVRPGEMSEHLPWLYSTVDQADSVLGCALVYALWGVGEWPLWTGLVILGTLVHLLINVALWSVGLRKHPL